MDDKREREVGLNDVVLFYLLDGRVIMRRQRDRYSIAVAPTNVVVLDAKGQAHVLPLLTMTGISYLPAKNGKKK